MNIFGFAEQREWRITVRFKFKTVLYDDGGMSVRCWCGYLKSSTADMILLKRKKKLFISIFLYNLCVYYVVACSIKTGKMLIYAVGLRNYVDYANLWFSNPSNIRPSQKMCLQLTVYSCYWGKIRENSVIDSFVLT